MKKLHKECVSTVTPIAETVSGEGNSSISNTNENIGDSDIVNASQSTDSGKENEGNKDNIELNPVSKLTQAESEGLLPQVLRTFISLPVLLQIYSIRMF